MKILVIQLARLGDIYMTWPALRALKRENPGGELHFLTRSKFEAATEGLNVVDRHIHLPTQFMLEPLIRPVLDLESSVERVDRFISSLKGELYDKIVNFTFSPSSSFIVHAISDPKTHVIGYSRHSDGYLAIPDEVSSYFYAQAGIGYPNRVHLTDIFISMLGLEYQESDWVAPRVDGRDFGLPEKYILVHIGASEAKKTLPPFKWARILKNFFDSNLDTPIVMIGSANERNLGEAIEAGVSRGKVINLIGQTQLREIFHLLRGAQLLVGCDSAPMHMASLTNTTCLNISFDSVNFWETGPKATLSYVYRAAFPEDVVSEEVGLAIHQILQGAAPAGLIERTSGLSSFKLPEEDTQELFTWNLIQALYLGANFPVTDDLQFCQAVEKISDVNALAKDHIRQIPDKGLAVMGPLIERSDDIMKAVSRLVPSVLPLVKWYLTEKLRIAPASNEVVAAKTVEVHEKLQRILSVYMLGDSMKAHESIAKE
ncbi:MAG: glycosyltransferase family 9 protein [Bdellovibrionaceae bacterium]|nr:glycosyltransferase family 9 protein [Pseudobdellovibrionaceae bacterium]